jgi:hypothetical protein
LPGHEAQILGDVMEDACCNLLVGLGYSIVDRRYPKPSIDIIADFVKPRSGSDVILQRPWFSPEGRTAFSAKEGRATRRDVTEMKKTFRQARRSHNQRLRKIKGCVLATNEPRTKGQIESLRRRDKIYCWDFRRLAFYAAKVRSRNFLCRAGRLIEYPLPTLIGSTCLFHSESADENVLPVRCVIFVDDHSCFFGRDEIRILLSDLNKAVLKPILRTTTFKSVRAIVSLHVLGTIDVEVARDAFSQYVGDEQSHPQVDFSLSTPLRVYSYAAAPWSSMTEELFSARAGLI